MVSVLALIMLIIYLIALTLFLAKNRLEQFKWIVFNVSVIVSIFVVLGRAIGNTSFNIFVMVLYDFTALIYLIYYKFNIKISKKIFSFFIILMIVLMISLINLVLNPDMPYVILMDTSMDSVYYGLKTTEKAVWSHNNFSALRDMILMCIGLIFSVEYFRDADKKQKLLLNIKKAFYVFFIVATVEFLINNLFSPQILRNAVYTLLNVDMSDLSKIWTAEDRFGYYGITVFFPEQSYISLMAIFYMIVFRQGIINNKDILWFLYSVCVLIMSGCTTGIVMIFFAVFIYISCVLLKLHKKNIIILVVNFIIIISVLSLAAYILISNADFVNEIVINTTRKIKALFSGGHYSTSYERSAATRKYGNTIAINAFLKSPIWGVGIGTTRGYGIISGVLANFGIIGILAYLMFLNSVFKFRLSGKWFLFIISIAYFSTILSVWYVYYFAIIPVYCVFGSEYLPNEKISLEDEKICQELKS